MLDNKSLKAQIHSENVTFQTKKLSLWKSNNERKVETFAMIKNICTMYFF